MTRTSPTKVTALGWRGRGLRRWGVSEPASTRRRFRCSGVRDDALRASEVLATVHPRPSGRHSHSGGARAFGRSLPEAFLVRVSACGS